MRMKWINKNNNNNNNNNITELNELISAGAKTVCEKIGIPSKKHERKVKTRTEISTRKPTKTTESDKTKEKRWTK